MGYKSIYFNSNTYCVLITYKRIDSRIILQNVVYKTLLVSVFDFLTLTINIQSENNYILNNFDIPSETHFSFV